MKVGVVVTVHWSDKIRPNGDFLLNGINSKLISNLLEHSDQNSIV